MTKTGYFKAALQASAGAMAVMALNAPAFAQQAQADEDEEVQAGEGEFLGVIDIGESTRSIQTGTATPVTQVNREEIEDRQASTIAELIDSVPGVSLVNGSTPIGSGINIRGFGANSTYGTDQKINIQVDGASVGSEELYRIGTQLFTDPLLYKTVEVIRGPVGGFEYGSGGIGGTVRLETIDAYDLLRGQTGFTAAQTLGGYVDRGETGWNTSTTVAAMPTENFEFLANYTYREGGTRSDGNGNPISNSEFELPSFLVKGAVHFGADNAHTIKATYNQTETAERDKPYDSFETTGGAFGNVDRDTKSRTIVAGYYFDPIATDAVNLSLVYSYADQQIDQEYVPGSSPLEGTPSFPFLTGTVNADHRYETSKVTLKNVAYLNTGGIRHNLRTGVEYVRKDRLDASAAPGGTDERLAAFLVNEMELFRGFTLTPAVRYEGQSMKAIIFDGTANETPISVSYEAFMGGVSARYELPFGLAVFGSWARTESFPILDDLESAAFRDQAERGETWEVGGAFNRTSVLFPNDRAAFKVNYYDSELTNATSQLGGATEVYIDGFEIEASYATASGFYADFNGNIVDGEFLNGGGVIADWNNIPANSYRLGFGKRFGGFDLRSESILVEDLYLDGVLDTEGYYLHNLHAIWKPQVDGLRNLSLRLSVENLFDEFYTNALATRPGPGRTVRGTVSLQL